VFFEYDSFDLRPDAQQQIAANADFLKQHPNLRFNVEGHCDERGSTEYNLALGDSRAPLSKRRWCAGVFLQTTLEPPARGRKSRSATSLTSSAGSRTGAAILFLQR